VPEPFDPQSLNRYSYVMNDPVNRIDPTGRLSIFSESSGGSGSQFPQREIEWGPSYQTGVIFQQQIPRHGPAPTPGGGRAEFLGQQRPGTFGETASQEGSWNKAPIFHLPDQGGMWNEMLWWIIPGKAVDWGLGAFKAWRAAKALPVLRQQYVKAVEALATNVPGMRQAGMTSEQIARALHAERRALGEQFKNATPPEVLEKIYQRNLERYGDRLGPSIEWLRDKAGKSWEQIIESATRPGGADLGF